MLSQISLTDKNNINQMQQQSNNNNAIREAESYLFTAAVLTFDNLLKVQFNCLLLIV